jgi:hypothetical protein
VLLLAINVTQSIPGRRHDDYRLPAIPSVFRSTQMPYQGQAR